MEKSHVFDFMGRMCFQDMVAGNLSDMVLMAMQRGTCGRLWGTGYSHESFRLLEAGRRRLDDRVGNGETVVTRINSGVEAQDPRRSIYFAFRETTSFPSLVCNKNERRTWSDEDVCTATPHSDHRQILLA